MSSMYQILRSLNNIRRDARGRRRLKRAVTQGPLFFDPNTLQGKRVAIIGPASPVVNELTARPVPHGAQIWRMNRGCEIAQEDPKRFGVNTDILFHNLNFEGPRGTGPLDECLLRRQGVQYVLFPHAVPRKVSSKVLKLRDLWLKQTYPTLLLPPEAIYFRLMADLNGNTPTAGLVALALTLSAPLAHLSVYGFTFFQTGYTPGYNSNVFINEHAADWATATGLHDPDCEADWARSAIRRHRRNSGFPITLGAGVARVLSLPEI